MIRNKTNKTKGSKKGQKVKEFDVYYYSPYPSLIRYRSSVELMYCYPNVNWKTFHYDKGEFIDDYVNPNYKWYGREDSVWSDKKEKELHVILQKTVERSMRSRANARQKIFNGMSVFKESEASSVYELLRFNKGKFEGIFPVSETEGKTIPLKKTKPDSEFRSKALDLSSSIETSFVNAGLQVLVRTAPFSDFLDQHLCEKDFCLLCELRKYKESFNQPAVATKINNQSKMCQQIKVIIDEGRYCFSLTFLKILQANCLVKNYGMLNSIYLSSFRQNITCHKYGKILSSKWMTSEILNVTVKSAETTSIEAALKNYCREEILRCPFCKTPADASQKIFLADPKKILIFQLNRMTDANGEFINKVIVCNEILNLRPFMCEADGDRVQYTLYAAILHKGSNIMSDEYVSYAKANDEWRCLNDQKLKPSESKPDDMDKNAFYVFYEKLTS